MVLGCMLCPVEGPPIGAPEGLSVVVTEGSLKTKTLGAVEGSSVLLIGGALETETLGMFDCKLDGETLENLEGNNDSEGAPVGCWLDTDG